MKNHQDNCKNLDEYLNDGLASADLESFEDHLKDCPTCIDEVAVWTSFSSNLQTAFGSIQPERNLIPTRKNSNADKTESKLSVRVALAATVLLASTIAMLWLLDDRNTQTANSDRTRIKVEIIHPPIEFTPVFADAEFDDKTIAILQCDESELTVYRVFPKTTQTNLE